MIIAHFVQFFFFGNNVVRIGRSAFRFIGATEILLVAFFMIFLFVFYLNRQIKISNFWFYSLFFILLSIIVIAQSRAVWIATVGGLFAANIFIKKDHNNFSVLYVEGEGLE